MKKYKKMSAIFESLKQFSKVFCLEKTLLNKIEEEDNRYYLIEENVKKVKEKISRSTFCAGTFLGEKKRSRFYPSITFFEIISTNNNSIPRIKVDKKTEWLFLCGRDIFKKSLENNDKINEGYVFVFNKKKEFLGVGFSKGQVILNVIDKGDFLRREK